MKLKLSKGDLKTVQAEGGWNSPEMVTKHYAKIVDEDRKKLAVTMEESIYGNGSDKERLHEGPSAELQTLMELAKSNPDLLTQFVQSIQSANTVEVN